MDAPQPTRSSFFESLVQEQVPEILANIDCERAQGFYFSPAIAAAKVPAWLQAYGASMLPQQ